MPPKNPTVRQSDADETLKCGDCGLSFVFTRGEQAFFEEMGFKRPRRCRECRQALRELARPRVS